VNEPRRCLTCDKELSELLRGRFCGPRCWPSRQPRFASDAPEAAADAPGDRDELIRLLWGAARRGSITAMRALLAEPSVGSSDVSASVIDHLAGGCPVGGPS